MADTSLNENRLGLLIWQTANVWQAKLRKILRSFNISLNEYLILETIYKLEKSSSYISQIQISNHSSIDTAVISSKLIFLENKNLIKRQEGENNRSKKLNLTIKGAKLLKILINEIEIEERNFFNKLNQETFNFTNSLKLLLGKKIRIKANYNEQN